MIVFFQFTIRFEMDTYLLTNDGFLSVFYTACRIFNTE